MDKNQKPSAEDIEQATAEVDALLKDSGTVHRWVREIAGDEIRAQRAHAAKGDSYDALLAEHAVEEYISKTGFMELLERARARGIKQRALTYPDMRARAAERAAREIADKSCPVCHEYSPWGHRPRRFSDVGDSSGDLNSCLPCFLEAQDYWRELRRTPKRTAAVRSAVDEILGAA